MILYILVSNNSTGVTHPLYLPWLYTVKNKIVTLTQIICHIRCIVQSLCDIQWTLRITDTLVHRLLSFIRGMSFIGVFYLGHPPLNSSNINFILQPIVHCYKEIHDILKCFHDIVLYYSVCFKKVIYQTSINCVMVDEWLAACHLSK